MSEEQTTDNNQNLGITEPITMAGGDSIVSFDELEAVENQAKSGAKQSAKQKEPSSKKAPKKEETKDALQEKVEKDDQENEKEQKVSDKSTSDKAGEGGKTPQSKMLKLKHGESDIDIPADGLVEVKINGKTQTVNIQELMNNYSGRAHLQQTYEKLKSEKDQFVAEKDQLKSSVSKLNEIVSKGNTRAVFHYLGEALGQDGNELYKKVMEEIKAKMAEADSVSPEEFKLRELQEENEFYRQRENELKQKSEQEKTDAEIRKSVRAVCEKHSISDSDFVDMYNELVKAAKENGVDPNSITTEHVDQYAKTLADATKVRKILSDVGSDSETLDNDVAQMLSLIKQNPELSDEDIKHIATEVYGKQSVKRLSKKVDKLREKNSEKKPNKDPRTDPVFFDEI